MCIGDVWAETGRLEVRGTEIYVDIDWSSTSSTSRGRRSMYRQSETLPRDTGVQRKSFDTDVSPGYYPVRNHERLSDKPGPSSREKSGFVDCCDRVRCSRFGYGNSLRL